MGDGNLGWNPGELLYGGGFGYESEPGDDTHGGLTLDYVGDRYYDPTIGRFISPDPLGLSGGLNLYAYAGDDPVNNVDPSGDLSLRDVHDWYLGGMGGFSGLVNEAFFGYVEQFGQTAGCYDSGGASGWDVARAGAKAFGLGAAYAGAGVGLYGVGARAIPALARFLPWAGAGGGKLAQKIEEDGLPQIEETVAPGEENPLITVFRWGREGLQPGDWVMNGNANWWNYLRSFKWQPGLGNEFAPLGSGQEFEVPASSVKWPQGIGIDGVWKGLFGQRLYRP